MYENILSAIKSASEKHKVFISFYHYDDEYYRNEFVRLFKEIMIDKSVNDGDINTEVSDEYIKRLIQEDYIGDASVVVVLCGPNTWRRKHVDWEISAGLNKKVGGYSGLIGIHLPNHPDYQNEKYNESNIPPRLADNLKTGFASIFDWTENKETMKTRIQAAFDKRTNNNLIDNSRQQYSRNL